MISVRYICVVADINEEDLPETPECSNCSMDEPLKIEALPPVFIELLCGLTLIFFLFRMFLS